MSGYTETQSPRVTKATLQDDDFLSEHLGQLLVRQPMSPKSHTSSNQNLPLDFSANNSKSIQRSASQSQKASRQMSKVGPRDNGMQSPKNNILGVSNDLTTPEIISPARDDLFNSFFAAKSSERQSCTSEPRNTFTPMMSRSGPGSISMSTSFGRKAKVNKAPLSTGTGSDKDSLTSLSSLSQQQNFSRRASEATQPSNESEELLEQIAPETPPDGGMCMTESVSTSSSLNYEFSHSSPNEEEKLQIFNEGGVIEPPEANEINTIARKDVQNANLLPIQRPAPITERGSSSQNSSRYTSITSSRFQSYRSTLSSVPTEMDTHNEDGEFVMDSRRAKKNTVHVDNNGQNSPNPSIAKHLAARSNSITLVPSGDDGRTFVFVSRDSDDPSLHSPLRRDGHTV